MLNGVSQIKQFFTPLYVLRNYKKLPAVVVVLDVVELVDVVVLVVEVVRLASQLRQSMKIDSEKQL